MEYKVYKGPSFNVHTIKTNKFKTSHMEVIFRNKAIKEKMTSYAFLVDILCENTKKYPSRRLFATRLEELYKTNIYGTTVRTGNILNSIFTVDFINPEYINESDYLENVIKMVFEVINNPNVVNKEFDLKIFNTVKERIKKDIESIKENPFKLSIREALNASEITTPTSYPLLGTLDDLERITPANLYDTYEELFKNNSCDIFVIGNLNMDDTVSWIKKYYINRYINEFNIPLMIENKIRSKALISTKNSDNIQANLVILYNTVNLNNYEKDIVFSVFNYLFGNGGLTCKLYQNLRENNSLCYGVNSIYLKHDNMLLIHVSLDNENIKKAINLVKKSLKDMVKGEFSLDDLEDAKKNMIISLDYIYDNNISILTNYIFNVYYELPTPDERKDKYKKVTKTDIMNVAKKIKINTIFTLEGGSK